MSQRKRLALLASGGGTTVEAILKACRGGRLPNIEPVVLITDRPMIGVVVRAEEMGLSARNHRLIQRNLYDRSDEFGEDLFRVLEEFGVNIVGQYGWLSLTPALTIERFMGLPGFRIMVNQHPAPPEVFGGKGMYGKRPHAAVLEYRRLRMERFGRRCDHTRVVSQFVDPNFDQGRVIRYKLVPIEDGDTPEKLQQRALPDEWETQIETLQVLSCEQSLDPRLLESRSYYQYPFACKDEKDIIAEARGYALTTPT